MQRDAKTNLPTVKVEIAGQPNSIIDPPTPLPAHVVEQIAQLVKDWKLGDTSSPGTPLPRLYVRPDEAARICSVSRRTWSAWQAARVIPFRRVGRTILFSVADIQQALDRFTVTAVSDPDRPRKRRATRISLTAEN